MIKNAFELPDEINKWEDAIMDYMDKHYKYLSQNISHITFTKKDESTKDGIGAVQYKNSGIEITIPIIIDDGELKEPNIGIYKEQAIPVDENMIKWVIDNGQQVGDIVERDSQHISNSDYLKQTGLFEEPEGGGYVKTSCYKDTIDSVKKLASMYPETMWIAKKLDMVTKFASDEKLIGMNMPIVGGPIYYGTGQYLVQDADMNVKLASDFASPRKVEELKALSMAVSPFVIPQTTGKYAAIMGSKSPGDAKENSSENSLIQISKSDTFGEYTGIPVQIGSDIELVYGKVSFDISPLVEKEDPNISMAVIIDQGVNRSTDIVDSVESPNCSDIGKYKSIEKSRAVIGDLYGVKNGYHYKKKDSDSGSPLYDTLADYTFFTNIMISMGNRKCSYPYRVDSKVSTIAGPNMKFVVSLVLVSLITGQRFDAIVTDSTKLEKVMKSKIKNKEIINMFRTDSNFIYNIPETSIFKGPEVVYMAADKNKVAVDILRDYKIPSIKMVVKKAGLDQSPRYHIDITGLMNNSIDVDASMADELVSYYLGKKASADEASKAGEIPLEFNDNVKIYKVAKIVAENRDAFIGAAAKMARATSIHFNKVAGVGNVVDGLIGVSFIDSARETDLNKISEQVLSVINSLGNLILLARMGKTAVPESETNRAFWALAELHNVLRG